MHKGILFLLIALTAAAQTKVDPARVKRVLDQAVVVDLHDDTTEMIVDEGYKLNERHDYGQVDVPRAREGGLTAIFFSIRVDSDRYTPIEAIRRAIEEIEAVRREVARNSSVIELATTADQVVAAKKRGRIAALMGLEGGIAIDSDLAVLRGFFDLGV